jgi:hypothetical protein
LSIHEASIYSLPQKPAPEARQFRRARVVRE